MPIPCRAWAIWEAVDVLILILSGCLSVSVVTLVVAIGGVGTARTFCCPVGELNSELTTAAVLSTVITATGFGVAANNQKERQPSIVLNSS